MLAMLPYLDKQEKKQLYNALRREQEEEMRDFHHDYDGEMLKRSGDRHRGYTDPPPANAGTHPEKEAE